MLETPTEKRSGTLEGSLVSDREREELAELLRYFNDHWMRKISMWNIFDISGRTKQCQ
jgi:hypothetical protein